MNAPETLSGGCLCGLVRYTALGRLDRGYACHCTDCQIRSGSSFATLLPVPEAGFSVSGETLSVLQIEGPGIEATLHVCPKCLTKLYTTNPLWQKLVILRVGTLARSKQFIPAFHIWIQSRQPWVVLPDNCPHFDTQPATPADWRELLR
ncbi:MAG: GFA family protein [Parvibaculaceae bacterium]